MFDFLRRMPKPLSSKMELGDILGVLVAALFFGALSYGGLVVNQRVPRELVEVLEALVILFAISARPLLERVARRMS